MGYSSPQNSFLPVRICWANFFMSPCCTTPFFAVALICQISNFTKYGRVIYHSICFLILMNMIPQKNTNNVFPTHHSHLFDLSYENCMLKNCQISKFTKYGHVTYHLICFSIFLNIIPTSTLIM